MPSIRPKDAPDHHDADLVIRFYELRRDPVMRESRHAINREFLPRTFDDVAAVAKPDHPLNAAYRQVGSYWEMVYGMARHGIAHTEFLLESNGEGLLLFAKVQPFLAEIRAQMSPRAFVNAEWVATNSELGKALAATFRGRIEKMVAAKG